MLKFEIGGFDKKKKKKVLHKFGNSGTVIIIKPTIIYGNTGSDHKSLNPLESTNLSLNKTGILDPTDMEFQITRKHNVLKTESVSIFR
jgi:hypothetical protein